MAAVSSLKHSDNDVLEQTTHYTSPNIIRVLYGKLFTPVFPTKQLSAEEAEQLLQL
jgi:hypothetical protein